MDEINLKNNRMKKKNKLHTISSHCLNSQLYSKTRLRIFIRMKNWAIQPAEVRIIPIVLSIYIRRLEKNSSLDKMIFFHTIKPIFKNLHSNMKFVCFFFIEKKCIY